ncbi:class I SAM-dependent methyltransferase [Oxalobacter sp. OttesenSCG-928-P03]|nr:class I SAM-dependent methyltransferase [Oxalobacter sp. OttesenSCG-928-P03]
MITLDHNDVIGFIKRRNRDYSKKLTNFYNYSRVVSLAYFERMVETYEFDSMSVAIVSGDKHEPELRLMEPSCVDIFSFEDDQRYDLDKPWEEVLHNTRQYDLVMANQVLEHISNPRQGLMNLAGLARNGGYIYLTIPTINCIHGEPYFYSAGYHPRFLNRLAEETGLKVIEAGHWGSRKYLLNAVIGDWLTIRQLKRASLLRNRFRLRLPVDFWSDGRFNEPGIITDCWVLLQKPEKETLWI